MKKAVSILLVFTLMMSLSLSFFESKVSASSFSGSQITVKLSAYLGNKSTVGISITGKYSVAQDSFALNGTYDIKVESGQLILYKNGTKIKNYGQSLTMNPEVYSTDNVIAVNGRKYLGTMRFEVEGGTYVRPYNTLPVEDYLKGVVSQEMSPSWGNIGGMEALKAQAIAARTYAQGVSPIDDGQTDQVYNGYYWYANTNLAVEATQGMVLRYNGQVIGANALYSSSNGGKTLSKVNSWGDHSWNRVPYLQVKEDPYDTRSAALGNNNVDWNFSLTKNQIDLTGLDLTNPALWWNDKKEVPSEAAILTNIKNWLQNNGHIDKKYEVKILSIPELSFDVNVPADKPINGHIKIDYWLRDTTTNTHVMENGQLKPYSKIIDARAYSFRSMIGLDYMKSPYIKSVQDDGTKFTINGGGWGHGIGMSQYGAFQMSKEGKSFADILNFYYPGTTIDDVLGPTVTNFDVVVNSDKVVSFSYSLDEDSTTSVTLVSPQRNILLNQAQVKGNAQFTWDASFLAEAGNYNFMIVVRDKNGNTTQGSGSFEILDSGKETVPIKLVLTAAKTYLYNGPNGEGYTGQALAPQTVYASVEQGDWYQIDTWIGKKWIEVRALSEPSMPMEDADVEQVNPETTTIRKINLLDVTNLYSSPSLSQTRVSAVTPQTVSVVEQQGDWFKINTWLGDKWIKPLRYSIAIDKKLSVSTITYLYKNPTTLNKPVSSISPQAVNVIEEIPNTGWYRISTWLGPMWIKQDVPKQPVNQTIILPVRTNLFHNPNFGEWPFSALAPQAVKTISKIENTGWYEINTWVGPKWIYVN